jgi:hypothetical protein
MMDVLTIFGEASFIFNFGLVTKSLGGGGAGCTFEEVVGKKKCQKMNVIFVITK